MANRRITRDECLVLLQAGWTIIEDRGQARLVSGRKSSPLAATTIRTLLGAGEIERLPAMRGDPSGRARYRLRGEPPKEIKRA